MPAWCRPFLVAIGALRACNWSTCAPRTTPGPGWCCRLDGLGGVTTTGWVSPSYFGSAAAPGRASRTASWAVGASTWHVVDGRAGAQGKSGRW
ncbi:hypothetical protein C2E23DRAFT_830470 [Lenzites betulinus]|nr:hypothetical protein C2E23DRAFT_830470 [Lenzites betulinus]